jgi:D-lactate dehydrogenase (cytochrome)
MRLGRCRGNGCPCRHARLEEFGWLRSCLTHVRIRRDLGCYYVGTVKLHPIPEHVVAAVCVFESLTDAAQAVAALKLAEIPGTRCELLDASSVQAFNAYNSKGAPASTTTQTKAKPMQVKATLFLEFQGSSQVSLNEQVTMTEAICVEDFGGSNFDFHSDEQERRALWSARHGLLYAIIAMRPGATSAFITDACVPLSHFANLIEATARDVEEKGLVGPMFGHAGMATFTVFCHSWRTSRKSIWKSASSECELD